MNSTAECDYSVAIPAYGSPDHVRATVEAALHQEFPADMTWEILVNDDCNPTPLGDALAPFRGRIRLERNDRNLGFAGNWNKTLSLARGSWVHMLTCDDLVAPEFASTIWTIIERAPRDTGLIHSSLRKLTKPRRAAARLYSWLRHLRNECDDRSAASSVHGRGVDAVRHVLLQGVRHPTVVVNRCVAGGIEGFRNRYKNFADEEFYVRLALAGDVVFVPRRLVTYRAHGAQLSRRDWLRPEFVDEYASMYDGMVSMLADQLTARDRALVSRRVALGAVKVAFVQALSGNSRIAQDTLRKARGQSPGIEGMGEYRKAALIAGNRVVRTVYQSLFV